MPRRRPIRLLPEVCLFPLAITLHPLLPVGCSGSLAPSSSPEAAGTSLTSPLGALKLSADCLGSDTPHLSARPATAASNGVPTFASNVDPKTSASYGTYSGVR
ncbi:hypothetical protein B0H13DRAFT_2326673 [Mycena leptocephala]|nr:hypothetical protein B0H13DRAFT_2326673 [Mycena leptocephala]